MSSTKTQTTLTFSPLFRSWTEVADTVSILVHCPEDKTYLLAYDPSLGFHLPYILATSTWDQLLTLFLKEYIGLPPTFKLGKLWRIVRILKSENVFLTNAVYEVPIKIEQKKKLVISKNIKGIERAGWVTESDIEAAHRSRSLMTPEILTYIPVHLNINSKMNIYQNIAIAECNNLIETPKEYVFPELKSCPYDFLIESAEFKPEHIQILYREYVRLTFPNIIMGYNIIERFALHAGWQENLWKTAVRGADLNDKGGISFKELLYLICVVEPGFFPTGIAGEARSRFIFRCFDTSRNQKLSPKEFYDFMVCLRSYQSSVSNSIENDIEKGLRSLDLKKGSDVPLQHFLVATSTQKFKGIDTMLKSKRSIVSTYITNMAVKGMDLTPGNISDKITASMQGASNIKDIEFKLSTRLTKIAHGRVNETIFLELGEDILDPSKARRPSRQHSDDLYNMSLPANQLLFLLKFFTSQYAHDEQNSSKEERQKKRFNWATETEFQDFVKVLINVCDHVAILFDNESRLLQLDSPLFIFGDIHGNIRDITCFDNYLWPLGINLLGSKLLFLGDYVDRGHHGLEVVAFLFAQKVRAPNQVYLIRGNHEVRSIQKNFTFYSECIKRCGEVLGNQVWEAINKAFDYMPLSAVIDKTLFCCHGGIPPPWNCPSIEFIKTIPRYLPQPEKNAIAWNLLWNDPIRENQINEALQMELISNNGFAKNKRRGTGHVFNTTALEKFLSVNNLSFLIRAHEAQDQGYQIHHKGKIITVFSSSYYNGGTNSAACLLVKQGSLKLIQINTNEFHF